jgi:hypothetical protein
MTHGYEEYMLKWKEHLVKNWLISTLRRQGNLLQRNIFSRAYKTSLHFTK